MRPDRAQIENTLAAMFDLNECLKAERDALKARVAELEGECLRLSMGIYSGRAERDRYRAALEHFTQWIMNNLTDRDEDTKEARNMARQARAALRGGEGK